MRSYGQRLVVAAVVLLSAVSLYVSHRLNRSGQSNMPVEDGTPGRIVSLAPSTTEVLFALGLGDRVVGVSRFCKYPTEVQSRTKIGGFEDLNYEAITALDPDLIVYVKPQRRYGEYFEAMGVRAVEAEHETVDGILDSIRDIGAVAGKRQESERTVSELRARMRRVNSLTHNKPRPRVLLAAGGIDGDIGLSEIYIAGRGGFYEELLTLAGGINAYEGQMIFPAVSAEGILHMDPDVVIEMVADIDKVQGGEPSITGKWNTLPELEAVKNGRVHVLVGDYVVIPGPRFVRILEDIARMIHPETVVHGSKK